MPQEERKFLIYNEIPEATPNPPGPAQVEFKRFPTLEFLRLQAQHFAGTDLTNKDWSVAQAFLKLKDKNRYVRERGSHDVCCTMQQAFNFATLCRMIATEKCDGDECRPQCEHRFLCAAERMGRDNISLAAGPLALLVPPEEHWDGVRPTFESSASFVTSLVAFMLLRSRQNWAQPAAGFAKDLVEPGDKLELRDDPNVQLIGDSLDALARVMEMCSGGGGGRIGARGTGKVLYQGLFRKVGLVGLLAEGLKRGRISWSVCAKVDARRLVGCLVVGSIVGGDLVLKGAETLLGKDFVRAAMRTMLMVWHRADEVEGWTPARIIALKGVDELPRVPDDDEFCRNWVVLPPHFEEYLRRLNPDRGQSDSPGATTSAASESPTLPTLLQNLPCSADRTAGDGAASEPATLPGPADSAQHIGAQAQTENEAQMDNILSQVAVITAFLRDEGCENSTTSNANLPSSPGRPTDLADAFLAGYASIYGLDSDIILNPRDSSGSPAQDKKRPRMERQLIAAEQKRKHLAFVYEQNQQKRMAERAFELGQLLAAESCSSRRLKRVDEAEALAHKPASAASARENSPEHEDEPSW